MKLILTIMALVLTVAFSVQENKTMASRMPSISEQINFNK